MTQSRVVDHSISRQILSRLVIFLDTVSFLDICNSDKELRRLEVFGLACSITMTGRM